MHDWLFANQPVISNDSGFSEERLTQMATQIGLDAAAFTACLADPAIADKVDADGALLAQKGVNSTPSFLVGEKMVVGADAAAVGKEIDAAAGSAP
jgi:2-hydroxychromene-2-carboxylate isomerase